MGTHDRKLVLPSDVETESHQLNNYSSQSQPLSTEDVNVQVGDIDPAENMKSVTVTGPGVTLLSSSSSSSNPNSEVPTSDIAKPPASPSNHSIPLPPMLKPIQMPMKNHMVSPPPPPGPPPAGINNQNFKSSIANGHNLSHVNGPGTQVAEGSDSYVSRSNLAGTAAGASSSGPPAPHNSGTTLSSHNDSTNTNMSMSNSINVDSPAGRMPKAMPGVDCSPMDDPVDAPDLMRDTNDLR